MRDDGSASIFTTIFIVGIMLIFTMHGCPKPQRARDILGAEGYTDIKIGGGNGFQCGGDGSATGFSAKSLAGHAVRGVVCCGLVAKSCTVRITNTVKLAQQ